MGKILTENNLDTETADAIIDFAFITTKRRKNMINKNSTAKVELEDYVLPEEKPTIVKNKEESKQTDNDLSMTISSLKILATQNNTDLLSLILNQNSERIISHLEEKGNTQFANFLKNFIKIDKKTTPIREL